MIIPKSRFSLVMTSTNSFEFPFNVWTLSNPFFYATSLCCSSISGADGGLDFGVLKVLDETKQTCSLKNKGKFEINFNFAFESTDGSPSDVGQLFTVIPNRGPLLPTDRPTQVQVIFRSKSEITIKDQPILKCQVNTVFGASSCAFIDPSCSSCLLMWLCT